MGEINNGNLKAEKVESKLKSYRDLDVWQKAMDLIVDGLRRSLEKRNKGMK